MTKKGLFKKQFTPGQALQKIKHYCAYQDRCHSEVKQKLYSMGAGKKHFDSIIAKLVEEGYLDEERFAIAFAGGRFRIKQWGRVKIKHEMKQKQVSELSINKALKQINGKEYVEVLNRLADNKYSSLQNEQPLTRKKKTMDYLLQKGFEWELVRELLLE